MRSVCSACSARWGVPGALRCAEWRDHGGSVGREKLEGVSPSPCTGVLLPAPLMLWFQQWRSCVEPAATETFLSRRVSLCLGSCPPSLPAHAGGEEPFPVCEIQPCHVPILCFCHPSDPLLLTAVPPSCFPCTQLLSCSALELPNPGLARWAADAKTL